MSGRDMEMARFLDAEDSELVPAPTRGQRLKKAGLRIFLGAGLVAVLCGIAYNNNTTSVKEVALSGQAADTSDAIEEFKWGPPKKKPSGNTMSLAEKLAAAANAKTIASAKGKFSESVARAFATLSKLAYCGPLPGIYASVAQSCSYLYLYGMKSSCEVAKFSVQAGLVRTISVPDSNEMDAYFAVVSRVQSGDEKSPVQNGILVSIRGSTNSYANSARDKQTGVESEGLKGCKNCGVHEGYYQTYAKIEPQLTRYLMELWCYPGSETSEPCTVYLTGHGSGSAVASIVAWQLAEQNYTVGTSYLFSTPQIGDQKFANAMNKRFNEDKRHGPLFQVTYGKDSVPRWPFNTTYVSWGIEAYYGEMTKTAFNNNTKYKSLCMAADKNCGVNQFKQDELTSKDSCLSPLSPKGDFCTLDAFGNQCYGGMGFEEVDYYASLWPAPPEPETKSDESAESGQAAVAAVATTAAPPKQPESAAAAWWHPAPKGKQVKEQKSHTDAESYYSLATLKAMAALSKIAYCGPLAGTPSVVKMTCSAAPSSICGKAGFGLVPTSVVSNGVSYQSEKTKPNYVQDTLYFFTAMFRRSSATYAEAPYFMPSEGCVLVFRGSANAQNMDMNLETNQVPLNDTECGKCTFNSGILDAWQQALQPKVIESLKKSGCVAKPTSQMQSNKVIIAGHSMGGTMTTLATYMLHKLGYAVELSWAFEGGRPGNPAVMKYIDEAMVSSKRPVAVWHVTHHNDFVTRYPRSVFAKDSQGVGRYRYQVHFPENEKEKAELCLSKKHALKNSNCGIFKYGRGNLSTTTLPNEAHCGLGYAPQGQMCMLSFYPATSPYAILPQCYFGGALLM